MKDIGLVACIEFQEVFFHGNISSPYEFAKNWETYYPLTVLGEIGTLLNNYCKQIRSPNNYRKEIENDSADIFIFLLTLGMMIERKKGKKVFSKIKADWSATHLQLRNESEFTKEVLSLINNTSKLLNKDNYNEVFFLRLFKSIKAVSTYVTKRPWQEVINNFHSYTLDKFTEFDRYTPDLWYRGSCYVNFSSLRKWIEKNKVDLPPKRLLFLSRMEKLQISH